MVDRDVLIDQHDDLVHIIEQLQGPPLDDHPGLRLLADSLDERRQKVESQLADTEAIEVGIVLDGLEEGVPIRIAQELLHAFVTHVEERLDDVLGDLPEGARTADRELLIVDVQQRSSSVALVLAAPSHPPSRRLQAPGGDQPALAAVLSGMLDELADGQGQLLEELGATLIGEPIDLEVELRALGEARQVRMGRDVLQQAITG